MSKALVKTEVPGIYRRGETGSFVVVVRQGAKQVKRSAPTMSKAKRLKAQLHTDVGRGDIEADIGITFAAYFEKWKGTFAGRTTKGIRSETKSDYAKMVKRHALDYFGRKRLRDIKPLHIRAYANHLADEKHMQPNTVKVNLAPVRAMFASAREDGIIRDNPCTGLRLAHGSPSADGDEQAKALSEEQLAQLIAAVPERYRLMVRFIAGTGLRISEAIGLKWSDIDFSTRRLRISRRVFRNTVGPPKSKYGRRTIPLSPGLAEALLEHREALSAPDDNLIFPSRTGKYFVPSNLAESALKPAMKATGLKRISFHVLRHTYASILFSRGLNVVQVSRLLGHHSAAFTLTVYVHMLPDDLPDTAFLDDVLTGEAGQTTRQTKGSETELEATTPKPAESAA